MFNSWVPEPVRKLRESEAWPAMSRLQRWRAVLTLIATEHSESPARLASAVALGLFCGIAPIWGLQSITAILLAQTLRLNKAVAFAGSSISIPPFIPFICAGALVVGHYMHTGAVLDISWSNLASQIPRYVGEFITGSIVLAAIIGAFGWVLTFLIARSASGKSPQVPAPQG